MPPPPPVNPQRLSPAESRERTLYFFHGLGVDVPLPVSAERPDAYTSLVRAIVSSAAVTSSRVSCTLTVSPAVANQYNTLHGGAVAAVAEAVGMACARAAAGDKEMFLGELSTAYLAAARLNDESNRSPQNSMWFEAILLH
uniref:Thioesterase domain-containing protein n=1 Tax=Zea mays TaxID=4577 RepID=A0A804Q6F5_MAIZE